MKLFKRIIAAFNLLSATLLFSLLIPAISYSAPEADESIFMDLGRIIKEKKQLVEKISRSVVMVTAYNDSGAESGKGSGFLIDREGHIITNASILKDAYSAEVITQADHYANVVIINRDADLDVALLKVSAENEVPLELDFGHKPVPGEKVFVIGKASASKKTFSEGMVSSINSIAETSELIEIQMDTPTLSYSASKDGPLLNMAGKVIGITGINLPGSQNFDGTLNIPSFQDIQAISIASLKPLLSKSTEPEQLHPAGSKLWTNWAARLLKTSALTVFITLYTMGFQKLMVIALAIIAVISAIQWLYFKLKKRK